MRSVFPGFVGNEALCSRMCEDIEAGRLSHAYIIEGPDGSGKHTLAKLIAAALSCERKGDASQPLPCTVCPTCRKILSGNSPDLTVIGREDKATLGVEAIRNLRRDIAVAPNDLSVKVYVIEDAHLLTTQAQNAFLLTLEEPPPYVLFLLLCRDAGALLETIRSRAPTLRTRPIPAESIREYLIKNHREAALLASSAKEELDEIVAAAGGSIGQALLFLDPKVRKTLLKYRQNAREFVRLAASRRGASEILELFNAFPQKREELAVQLEVLLLCLRDLLLTLQTDASPLCFFFDREEACRLAYAYSTPGLYAVCNSVEHAGNRLRANANIRLLLTTLGVEAGLLGI